MTDIMPVSTETLVADRDTHELLAEVIVALQQMRTPRVSEEGPGVALDTTGLATDSSLALLNEKLSLLAEALEDIASRPPAQPKVEVLPPNVPLPPEIGFALARITKLLEEPPQAGLDEKTIKAMMDLARPRMHSSGSSRTEVQLRNSGGTVIDPATNGAVNSVAAAVADLKNGISDFETRFDYDVRVDSNPVYIGKNTQGADPSLAGWSVFKFDYDVTSRVTRIQIESGAWDDRASLF